jgi:hypothetical protein
MRKRKKKVPQVQKELPNIYGRKPSSLLRSSDGLVLKNFDSRRQARMQRAEVCQLNGLQTYETHIVSNGAQIA